MIWKMSSLRPGSGIEIDEDDLLPGPQQHRPVQEGNGDRRSLQLTSQMAVAVVFTGISRIVLPGRIGRHGPIPKCLWYRP